MEKVNIGLNPKDRERAVDILNTVLADEYVLYTKTRNYHWNVISADFSELHKLFESQYSSLEEMVDEVAERARFLGGRSLGSLKEFLDRARLKESTGQAAAKAMISSLLSDHESLIKYIRSDLTSLGSDFSDFGTLNFLTGMMEKHEKMAWFLRMYKEGK